VSPSAAGVAAGSAVIVSQVVPPSRETSQVTVGVGVPVVVTVKVAVSPSVTD